MIISHSGSPLVEGIEPESFLNRTLIKRQECLPLYQDMGPPDLCYLQVESQKKSKFLKKMESIKGSGRGFYHYVYGVDTSSSACVAAYITDCINLHHSKKFKKDDVVDRVIKGTYCIYDIVTKRDIRVEIQIPEGT